MEGQEIRTEGQGGGGMQGIAALLTRELPTIVTSSHLDRPVREEAFYTLSRRADRRIEHFLTIIEMCATYRLDALLCLLELAPPIAVIRDKVIWCFIHCDDEARAQEIIKRYVRGRALNA